MSGPITILPVAGVPEVRPGDDLPALLGEAIAGGGTPLQPGDVLVVTHKIVSKAEGRVRTAPTEAAYRAVVEDESVAALRRRGDLVIAKTRHGFICANAGVDRSNADEGTVVLLPVDPDRSAHRIRLALERRFGLRLAVVVTDTFGRPWRRGLVDVAIGVSGLPALLDLRGTTDGNGRILEVTEIALVDELAAAADLVMGKADRIPAAIVRGLAVTGEGRARDLVRPADEDLFR